MDLAAVIDKLAGVPADKLAPIVNDVLRSQRNLKFVPNPGPQTDAWFSPADLLLYGGQAGGGKAMQVFEYVPVPTQTDSSGYKRHGDLQPGDLVYRPCGTVTAVIARTEPFEALAAEVEFNTGEVVVCDPRHLWHTFTDKERDQLLRSTDEWRSKRKAKRASRAVDEPHRPNQSTAAKIANANRVHDILVPTGEVRTTEAIADSLRTARGRVNHSIDATAPVDLQRPAYLPIPPYLFGLWLGDGEKRRMAITMASADWLAIADKVEIAPDRAEDDGRPERKTPVHRLTWYDQMGHLSEMGVKNAKHIPAVYLRAPLRDRLELLRGMMDTDGCCNADGQMELGFSDEALARDAHELLCTLGVVSVLRRKPLKAKEHRDHWRMKFTAPFRCFHLPRKADRQQPERARPARRYITDVRLTDRPVLVSCIQVAHDDGLYLVGRSHIPTHNSGLLCGLALQQHTNSLLVRRQGTALEGGGGLIGDLLRLHGSRNGYSGKSPPTLRTEDGRTITFGSAPNLGDEERYQGRPRDLFGADEATQFLEQQIDFFMGWVRTISPGQRTRSVLASNPPLSAEGDWVIRKFRPWLDLTHPDPAEPGELRWFIRDEKGEEAEVRDGTPVERGGHTYHPTSRTFIPASLADNPFIVTSQYQKQLDALPGFYRDAIRDGNFMASRVDHPEQAIPTAWIQAAMDRWQPDPPDNVPMTCIAVDPAQGGGDRTALAMRYGHWTDKVVTVPGADTPTGRETMALVLQHRKHLADIIVDCGGGYGGETVSRLSDNGLEAYPYKGADRSTRWSEDQAWRYANLRAETVWALREALDPGQSGGSVVQLPPDQDLLSELAAYRFTADRTVAGQQGLLMESKDKMKKRLGRSPDKADAVLMAWWYGPHSLTHGRVWDQASQVVRSGDRPVRVISGRRKRR